MDTVREEEGEEEEEEADDPEDHSPGEWGQNGVFQTVSTHRKHIKYIFFFNVMMKSSQCFSHQLHSFSHISLVFSLDFLTEKLFQWVPSSEVNKFIDLGKREHWYQVCKKNLYWKIYRVEVLELGVRLVHPYPNSSFIQTPHLLSKHYHVHVE